MVHGARRQPVITPAGGRRFETKVVLVPGAPEPVARPAAGVMNLPDAAWTTLAMAFGKSAVPAVKRLATLDEIAVGAR